VTSVARSAPTLPVRIASVSGALSSLDWAHGRLWAADGRRLLRIDPDSVGASSSTAVAGCEDSQLAAGLGAVWLVSGDCADPGVLTSIDPQTGRVAWHVDIPASAEGVATWRGSVWVTTVGTPPWRLMRVDPARHGVVTLGLRGKGLMKLVAAGPGLWAEPAGFGGVAHLIVNPSGVAERVLYSDEKHGIAFGSSIVWAALGGQVLPLNPTSGQQTGPGVEPPSQITSIAYGDTELWIATESGDVYRWPGGGPLVRAAHLPWAATDLTVGGGYVWATSYAAGQIARVGPTPTA
jgi:hypothetical protein